MFSSRIQWDLQTNRITRAIEARRRGGSRILDLTESNPTHAGLHYPAEILAALADPRILRYDPAASGTPEARAAVAAYYSRRGMSVDPAHILLTASTSEGYAYLFKLLCDPGDAVLVPRPSYPLFEFLAHMDSVEVRQYPLVYYGGWSIDLEALAAAITPRTRAIVLVNPNNPTGSYLRRGELRELVRLASAHGLALISDEVFSDYPLTTDSERVATVSCVQDCLAFSMSGLSKAAGLPQMKLGWIVTAGPENLRREACERLEWIADTYLSVSTPVQCAATALLEAGEDVQAQIRARTAANLALARQRLAGSPMSILPVEGGWYITLQAPRVRGEEEWAIALLEEGGVLVQPGFFYDFEAEAFLVVSLLTDPTIFREGTEAIARFA